MRGAGSIFICQAAKAIGGTGGAGGSGPPIIPIRGDDVFGNGGEHPRNWDEFIGQDNAKAWLRTAIDAAKWDQRPVSHILLESDLGGSGGRRWPSWSAPNAALTTASLRNQAQRRGCRRHPVIVGAGARPGHAYRRQLQARPWPRPTDAPAAVPFYNATTASGAAGARGRL